MTTAASAVPLAPTGTTQATYRIRVNDEERVFTVSADVFGLATGVQAAREISKAAATDAYRWLSDQRWTVPEARYVKRWYGWERTTIHVERTEPADERHYAQVIATIEIDGKCVAEATTKVETVGDPYQSAIAALRTTQSTLHDWTWKPHPQ